MFPEDSFFISQTDLVEIVKKYSEATFLNNQINDSIRRISDSYSILDRNSIPAFYIFNYSNNDGTIIISADYRFNPILYFSKSGAISKTDSLTNSIAHTLEVFLNKIEALRYESDIIESNLYKMQTNSAYNEWNQLNNMFNKCCLHPVPWQSDPYDPCANYIPPPATTFGPLLTTTWRQGDPYNRLRWHSPCSDHALAGCVAIAVMEIFWNRTLRFQWPYKCLVHKSNKILLLSKGRYCRYVKI